MHTLVAQSACMHRRVCLARLHKGWVVFRTGYTPIEVILACQLPCLIIFVLPVKGIVIFDSNDKEVYYNFINYYN